MRFSCVYMTTVIRRKAIAMLILLTMICMSLTTVAEGVDFAAMSDEELQSLIDGASAELNGRNGEKDKDGAVHLTKDSVLIDHEGIVVTLTGENACYPVSDDGEYNLYIGVIVENNTDSPIYLVANEASINQWTVPSYYAFDVKSGNKRKDEFVYYEIYNISRVSEIENMKASFVIYDDDSGEIIYETDTITLVP